MKRGVCSKLWLHCWKNLKPKMTSTLSRVSPYFLFFFSFFFVIVCKFTWALPEQICLFWHYLFSFLMFKLKTLPNNFSIYSSFKGLQMSTCMPLLALLVTIFLPTFDVAHLGRIKQFYNWYGLIRYRPRNPGFQSVLV